MLYKLYNITLVKKINLLVMATLVVYNLGQEDELVGNDDLGVVVTLVKNSKFKAWIKSEG